MSESHFDKYEHYNYDQDKAMFSGGSGKQRSKLEVGKICSSSGFNGDQYNIAIPFSFLKLKETLAKW